MTELKTREELMDVTGWRCSTNTYWRKEIPAKSRPGEKRLVEFKSVDMRRYGIGSVYDFTCTCYQVSSGQKRTCDHIRQAKEHYCGWDQLEDGGEPIQAGTELRCPTCGAPVQNYTRGGP